MCIYVARQPAPLHILSFEDVEFVIRTTHGEEEGFSLQGFISTFVLHRMVKCCAKKANHYFQGNNSPVKSCFMCYRIFPLALLLLNVQKASALPLLSLFFCHTKAHNKVE
jgi:hypothetical protein